MTTLEARLTVPEGNIAGPFFYKTTQAPRYELGIWSMIGSHLIEVVLVITLRTLLSVENRRRDNVQREMPGGLEGRDLDATAFGDLTDRENLNFRWVVSLIECCCYVLGAVLMAWRW